MPSEMTTKTQAPIRVATVEKCACCGGAGSFLDIFEPTGVRRCWCCSGTGTEMRADGP